MSPLYSVPGVEGILLSSDIIIYCTVQGRWCSPSHACSGVCVVGSGGH